MWIIAAAIIATLVVVILVVNFRTPEKKIQHAVHHLYGLTDPQFEREMSTLLGPAILTDNKITALQNENTAIGNVVTALGNAVTAIGQFDSALAASKSSTPTSPNSPGSPSSPIAITTTSGNPITVIPPYSGYYSGLSSVVPGGINPQNPLDVSSSSASGSTPALTLNVNLNGGMVVGNSGMQQFTQMMMPNVVTALRQAGAKV